LPIALEADLVVESASGSTEIVAFKVTRTAPASPSTLADRLFVEYQQYVDRAARAALRRWVRNNGLTEGRAGQVQINRWLRDPSPGGTTHRIPDVRVPGERFIFDATIGQKSLLTPQVSDFVLFSGGDRVTIVRPSALGGSYSLLP
jgi:hypothetical protein